MLQPRGGMWRGRACVTHAWRCYTRQRTLPWAALCSCRLVTDNNSSSSSSSSNKDHREVDKTQSEDNTETVTTTTMEVNPGVRVTTTRHAGGKKLSITIRSPPRARTSHVNCAPEAHEEACAALHPGSPPALPSSTAASAAQTHSEAIGVSCAAAPSRTEDRRKTHAPSSAATATAAAPVHHRPASASAAAAAVAQGARVHFTEPVKRIILIRNGMSEANCNPTTYVTTPDWRIPLLEEGKQECVAAGRRLANLVADEPVYFYYSPYIRSRQSLRYVLQGYDEGRRQASVGGTRAPQWWDSSATRLIKVQQEQQEEREQRYANESRTRNNNKTSNSDSERGPQVSAPLHMSRPDAYYDQLAESDEMPITPNNTNHNHHYMNSSTSSTSGSHNGVRGQPVNQLNDTALLLRPDTQRHIIGVREDVRLRDGDIGRYDSVAEFMHHLQERDRYGNFFYRFPHGESGADVCDRVTSFLDAFQRERLGLPMDTNVVLITHGLTIRMFVTRWFHLTVDTFHTMRSPPTGFLATLTRLHHQSRFQLDDDCFAAMRLPLSLNEKNGYKYRNKELLGSMSTGAPYM